MTTKEIKDVPQKMKIFEFGMAPNAKLAGFDMLVETVVSTDKTLLDRYANDDAVYVRGPSIQSRPGMFEFARFENKARRMEAHDKRMDFLTRQVPCVIYPGETALHFVVAPAEEPTCRLGVFHNAAAAKNFCTSNYLAFSEHDACPTDSTGIQPKKLRP